MRHLVHRAFSGVLPGGLHTTATHAVPARPFQPKMTTQPKGNPLPAATQIASNPNSPGLHVFEHPSLTRIAILASSGIEAEEIRDNIFGTRKEFVSVIHAATGFRFEIQIREGVRA